MGTYYNLHCVVMAYYIIKINSIVIVHHSKLSVGRRSYTYVIWTPSENGVILAISAVARQNVRLMYEVQ